MKNVEPPKKKSKLDLSIQPHGREIAVADGEKKARIVVVTGM